MRVAAAVTRGPSRGGGELDPGGEVFPGGAWSRGGEGTRPVHSPGGRIGTGVTAVILADVALEATDAVTFLTMAVVSQPRPHGRQLLSLAALILPRVAFAVLGALVLRVVVHRGDAAAVRATAFLGLVAVQGAAGLFLLWGVGGGPPARVLLTGMNALAAGTVLLGSRSRGAPAPRAPGAETSRRPG